MEPVLLAKENIKVSIKNFGGELHLARMNWVKLFEAVNSLYIGAFTYVDRYPYDEGCGVCMFKLNIKTGEFTQLLNLLEEHEMFDGVDIYA